MKFLLILALAILSQGRNLESNLSSRLRTMSKADTVNIFITMKEGTEEVLQAIEDTRFETRTDKINAMYSSLHTHAERVQAGVKSLLEGRFEYKSYWITSQVYVKGATFELIMDLAQRNDIKSVTEEDTIELDTKISGPIIQGRQRDEHEWGVQKIQAPQARFLLNQTTGVAPVIVSNIDTGVRYTHEALRDNFLGTYGWFDPYDKVEIPTDGNGHGTHTIGTIAGKNGIGVYPEARWSACRGCYTSSCMQSALLACAEFFVCPTLPDGSSADCSKAPNLVSNSWGGGRGATWFDDAIAAFHTADIIPLFSIGNSGPSCNTANSPGDRDVIGVGSTTVGDSLSTFSSVGPTIDGRMKPDISAPGSDVLSAYHTSDDAYRSLSGTSMACPHAAGLTAVLMAYRPEMRMNDIKFYITQGSDTSSLVSSGRTCYDIPDTGVFPNHHFGAGRINAYMSLVRLMQSP